MNTTLFHRCSFTSEYNADCVCIINETMVVHMTWVRTFFNNYSNHPHPRMCVLTNFCGNVDKHSPFDIYIIYIYIYILHTGVACAVSVVQTIAWNLEVHRHQFTIQYFIGSLVNICNFPLHVEQFSQTSFYIQEQAVGCSSQYTWSNCVHWDEIYVVRESLISSNNFNKWATFVEIISERT